MLCSSNLAWPFLLLLLITACRERPSPQSPSLSSPEKTSASGISEKEAVAEAEVKASSGPIELSLLLHSKNVRVDDSFWYKLRIRNRGTTVITLVDDAFTDPSRFHKQLDGRFGLYIEVLGPDGKALPVRIPRRPTDDYAYDSTHISGLLEADGPEEKALVEMWTKEGLDDSEIRRKLIAHNLKKQPREPIPSVVLKPGETVETHSWFHHGIREEALKRPKTRPIGDFTELEFFHLEQPGRYRLRAVVDWHRTAEDTRKWKAAGLDPPAWWVVVRTPWIEANVRP